MNKILFIFFLILPIIIIGTAALFSQITPAQFAGTWTAPADRNNGNTCAEYDVRYSKQPITETNFYNASRFTTSMTPAAPGEIENLTITGLDEETIYYFAIKTKDIAGNWSNISNIAVDTTGDFSKPFSITDLY